MLLIHYGVCWIEGILINFIYVFRLFTVIKNGNLRLLLVKYYKMDRLVSKQVYFLLIRV